MEREIGVEVKTSLNLPSVREMRADIEKLKDHKDLCAEAIKMNRKQIKRQQTDKKHLVKLSENPVDEDGIEYNQEACAQAAKKCDANIGMFRALIDKEKAKINQLDYMINEIEDRICLSEQMSQSIGS